MTNRGVIREVNLSEAAVEAFSAIESPGLKNLFSAEGVRQLFSQAAVELPEAAVVTGSNWTASSATASPLGTLKHDRTYTVAANEVVDGKTLERIELSGDLAVESSEQTAGKSKLVDQALSGKMLFDTEAGRLVTCQSTQAFTTERPYREFKIKVVTTAETKMTISPQ